MSEQAMKNLYSSSALIATMLLIVSCQKEISITEFADDYGAYQPELRIEAILDIINPENSIVRADRTIEVNDTTLFNGRDDDGDWNILTDDTGEDGVFASDGPFGIPKDEGEGNGVPDPGEPHVDEYDEIISQLHDSTLTVQLYEVESGLLVIDFAYFTKADSFIYTYTTASEILVGPEDLKKEVIYYGGYRPSTIYNSRSYFNWYEDYEFRIVSGDRLITGTTTPLPMAKFVPDRSLSVRDTLYVALGNSFRWLTEADASYTWVSVEQILGPDSMEVLTSHLAVPLGQTEEGKWIGEDMLSLYNPGLYRWTVTVLSQEYGAYIYSDLQLRDEQLSNLRDDKGRVVLGFAGSVSPRRRYVRLLPYRL